MFSSLSNCRQAPVEESVEDTSFDVLSTALAEQMTSIAQLMDSEDDDEQEQMTSRTDDLDSDEDDETMLHYKPTQLPSTKAVLNY